MDVDSTLSWNLGPHREVNPNETVGLNLPQSCPGVALEKESPTFRL